jgi:hypothetical protein
MFRNRRVVCRACCLDESEKLHDDENLFWLIEYVIPEKKKCDLVYPLETQSQYTLTGGQDMGSEPGPLRDDSQTSDQTAISKFDKRKKNLTTEASQKSQVVQTSRSAQEIQYTLTEHDKLVDKAIRDYNSRLHQSLYGEDCGNVEFVYDVPNSFYTDGRVEEVWTKHGTSEFFCDRCGHIWEEYGRDINGSANCPMC